MPKTHTCLTWGVRLLGLCVLLATGLRSATATPGAGSVLYLPIVQRPQPLVLPPLPDDWLVQVNFYRASARLPPVTENAAWSAGNVLHSRYSVKTDTLQHDEDPGSAWYTVDGQAAAQKSNLAATFDLQASDAWAIEAWMQAPFHALGMLDPRLGQVGYGIYREAGAGLETASGLDVIRGLNYALPAAYPVIWPAAGTVIPLTRHWGEYPDPLPSCPGYAEPTGLPLIVQLGPGNLTPAVTASAFARGSTPLAHCVFHESNYSHPDGTAQALGRAILAGRDAVVLIPRAPLSPGATYTASLTADGRTYTWSFSIASNAPAAASHLAVPTFAGAPSASPTLSPPLP